MKLVNFLVNKVAELIRVDVNNLWCFIKYGFIGVSGATLDFLIFTLLTRVFTVNYLIANIFSVSIGIINNFILNAFLNFKVKDKLLKRFFKFYSIGLLGLGISSGLLFLMVSFFGVDELVSKFSTIVVVTIVQYSLNKKISFKK